MVPKLLFCTPTLVLSSPCNINKGIYSNCTSIFSFIKAKQCFQLISSFSLSSQEGHKYSWDVAQNSSLPSEQKSHANQRHSKTMEMSCPLRKCTTWVRLLKNIGWLKKGHCNQERRNWAKKGLSSDHVPLSDGTQGCCSILESFK